MHAIDGAPYRRLFAAAVALFLGAAGCALQLPPVPVDGTPEARDRLVGEWFGEYTATGPANRTGSIVFRLEAGEHHAHGDVVMSPRLFTGAFRRPDWDRPPAGELPDMTRHTLTIEFVWAEEDSVIGVLDPYWDPEWRREARTSFRGVLRGDVIEGTFVTSYSPRMTPTRGRWRVTRQVR